MDEDRIIISEDTDFGALLARRRTLRPSFILLRSVEPIRNDVGYEGMRWITVGPADQPGTSIVLQPPDADPGVTDDERRMIAEMMAKGTYAGINRATSDPHPAAELTRPTIASQGAGMAESKMPCWQRSERCRDRIASSASGSMLIRASAPELSAKLWYGQPAYANNGKVVCFFRGAEIDKERNLTVGGIDHHALHRHQCLGIVLPRRAGIVAPVRVVHEDPPRMRHRHTRGHRALVEAVDNLKDSHRLVVDRAAHALRPGLRMTLVQPSSRASTCL